MYTSMSSLEMELNSIICMCGKNMAVVSLSARLPFNYFYHSANIACIHADLMTARTRHTEWICLDMLPLNPDPIL